LYAGFVQRGGFYRRGTRIANRPAVKIAQVAPREGDSRRIVSYLAEELERLGHRAAVLETEPERTYAEFDVVHFHVAAFPLPVTRRKSVVTLHGALDGARETAQASSAALVSVSRAQRAALPDADWAGTIPHGLTRAVFPLNPIAPLGAARYLAFLGNGPDGSLERAVEIGRRAGLRVRPGAALDETSKPAFLGNAAALFCTTERDDPFPLAMIEAMSCGTPVVAWARGAAAEIVEPGVTGFLVASVDEAARAVAEAARLDRSRVRARFEQRFTAERMARDYLSLYRSLGTRIDRGAGR
jgi:glycosyltransferase involved in cell wall biosynthesis